MKKIIWLFVLTALFLQNFTFAASNIDSKYIPPREDSSVVDKNISKRVEVIFYRIGGTKEYVPTVKVNDNIVGSLMPDNYAKTFVCNKKIKVGVAQRGDSQNVTQHSVVLDNNSNILFLKVIESPDHKFTLVQVNSNEAKSEISGFRLKSNIINRHVPNCELNAKNQTSYKEVISSTLLSLFFKTDSFALTNNAKKELDKFISWIKDYKNIDAISIKAYADIRESKKYNLSLSQKRAKSVRDYIAMSNINIPIITKGMGETSNFSKNCNELKGLALDACLQEDRRADLDITLQKGVIND